MSARFEELDSRATAMGAVSLRRRLDPVLAAEVFEVKLDDAFLMSSAFTAGEVELARLGLAVPSASDLDVVVGGLGLGYTAAAVLENARVRSLVVVEALTEVVEWHQRGLLPVSASLTSDRRCRFVIGDFFAMARAEDGFDPDEPDRRFDAVLVDIDHTPSHVLHPSHGDFYGVTGLGNAKALLRPGGVFALWSDDPPDDAFVEVLAEVFVRAMAHVITFDNPYTRGQSSNTVYVATTTAA